MSGVANETDRKRWLLEFHHLLRDLRPLLDDENVSDIMVNPNGSVFVERIGEDIQATNLVIPAATRASLVKTAVTLGGGKQRDGWPILETRVPGLGWRFEGVLPPIVEAPAFAIRKPARRTFALDSYLAEARMSEAAFAALRHAVVEARNILVVGGTGSGKTTLANALLAELAEVAPEVRVVVLEDTPELQPLSRNCLSMVTSYEVGHQDLLKATMRLRPDRIVVGEVRGAEVAAMLSAWNTGHPGGLCTVHADNARAGLLRLEQLWCAHGGERASARLEIAQAVHVVVHIERVRGHRRVREVLSVDGLSSGGEYLWTKIA